MPVVDHVGDVEALDLHPGCRAEIVHYDRARIHLVPHWLSQDIHRLDLVLQHRSCTAGVVPDLRPAYEGLVRQCLIHDLRVRLEQRAVRESLDIQPNVFLPVQFLGGLVECAAAGSVQFGVIEVVGLGDPVGADDDVLFLAEYTAKIVIGHDDELVVGVGVFGTARGDEIVRVLSAGGLVEYCACRLQLDARDAAFIFTEPGHIGPCKVYCGHRSRLLRSGRSCLWYDIVSFATLLREKA